MSADVYARYLRLKGEDAVLVSGSDEHGAPIEVEALKQGIPPRSLTNKNHRLIKQLLKAFDIRFDNYTRTESQVHKQFVRNFYQKVEKNGFVYRKTLTLPYCEKDRRFLPDRFVEGECPYCHAPNARGDQCDNCGRILEPTDLINPYCVLCRQTPVLRETSHWFFDLPKFSEKLQSYVADNPNFPENARNFSLGWLKEGLKPRSLTRDLSWGIEAPFKGSEGKTLYVWMEAVLGYVSSTIEWAEKRHRPSLWKKYWFDPESRNIHFIGKDNIPFHTIVFPGLLQASGDPYNLPWQVSSTEYVQFEGEKFSKSRGIGLWMDEALEIEEAEYWRYALISLRPEVKDTNFTLEEFERKINTELNDVIGNFVHRTISFLQTNFDGRVPQYSSKRDSDTEILLALKEAPAKVEEKLGRFRLKEGLKEVVDLSRQANRYLNEQEPWKKIKTAKKEASQSLGISVQVLATIAIMLQPFLPMTSQRILKSVSKRGKVGWEEAGHYLASPGTRVLPLKPLFHKVSAAGLRARLNELRGGKKVEIEA